MKIKGDKGENSKQKVTGTLHVSRLELRCMALLYLRWFSPSVCFLQVHELFQNFAKLSLKMKFTFSNQTQLNQQRN